MEARKKYKGYYIGFMSDTPADPKENFDEVIGKVLYTADTYNEQNDIPAETDDGRFIEVLYGFGLKDLPMGGLIIDNRKG